MTDAIWIALIGLLGVVATTVGSVMVARINTQLRSISRDAAEARHQTKNSHEENLRDSLDRQHDETKAALDRQHGETKAALAAVAADVQRLDKSVGGLHEDVRLLHTADGRQSDSVERLRAEIPTQIEAAIQACRHRDVLG